MKRALALGLVVLLGVVLCGVGAAAATRFAVTVLADPIEGGTVLGGGMYDEGTAVKVVAEANVGYQFVNWTEEGVEVSISQTYEFTAQGGRTLVAHFTPIQYSLGLSGTWTTYLHVLPGLALDYTRFQVRYGFGYGSHTWNTRAILLFKDSEFTEMQVHGIGEIGLARIGGGMYFDLRVPEYRSAYFSITARLADLTAILRVQHSAKWGGLPGPYMLYTTTIRAAPLTLAIRFDDECTGIAFKDVTVSLKGIGLCCGICYDATLKFTKAVGFEYIEFTTKDIPFCCGISFDAAVKFTVDEKAVTITPKWKDLGEACIKVYGDVRWVDKEIQGIDIYGFRIRCCLGEPCPRCPGGKVRSPYAEFVTALNPKKLAWAKFQGDEFEYMKLGFCGPGCCGAAYSLELTAYFQPAGTLFGISRLLVSASVPVMDNLAFEVTSGTNVGSGATTLDVGWDLKF
ncbi:MAG: hypothetical protein NUV94_07205 [Candidatus Acetothermia bacterium]|nr:hypothetical protein [Candidatus Acetothermia bacterium]